MRLGIDVRSIQSGELTGVGYHTARIVNHLISNAENYGFSSVHLISSGRADFKQWLSHVNANNVFFESRIAAPNKLLNILWMCGSGPRIEKKAPIDFLWIPNINFYRLPILIPYAITVHDLSYIRMPQFYSLKRRVWHFFTHYERLISDAAAIFAVSEFTRQDLLNLFPMVSEKKIFVVHPGIDTETLLHENCDTLLRNYDLPQRYITFVGTIEPRKNIQAALRAFLLAKKKHPRLTLVIIGSYGWRSRRLMRDLTADSDVRVLGYVPRSIRDEIIAHSQCLIWPSLYEGFGFPPLEAFTFNLPVITSYRSSLPEVLQNAALYANPYDINQMARLLDEILANPRVIPSKIQEDVLSTFSWSGTASRIASIMQAV